MTDKDRIHSTAKKVATIDLPSMRMLRVIECLATKGPQTYEDLRLALGMTKSTTWRIVTILRDAGWVRVRQAGRVIELDHRLDDLFATASFSDREFAEFSDGLIPIGERHKVHLDLYVLDSGGHPTLVETTRRLTATAPEIEVDVETIALAIQSATPAPRRMRGVERRLDVPKTAFARPGLGQEAPGRAWASDGALIACLRGKMGTPAAIRVSLKGREADRGSAVLALEDLQRTLSGLVDAFGKLGSDPM